jgi:hypothetical protein
MAGGAHIIRYLEIGLHQFIKKVEKEPDGLRNSCKIALILLPPADEPHNAITQNKSEKEILKTEITIEGYPNKCKEDIH